MEVFYIYTDFAREGGVRSSRFAIQLCAGANVGVRGVGGYAEYS